MSDRKGESKSSLKKQPLSSKSCLACIGGWYGQHEGFIFLLGEESFKGEPHAGQTGKGGSLQSSAAFSLCPEHVAMAPSQSHPAFVLAKSHCCPHIHLTVCHCLGKEAKPPSPVQRAPTCLLGNELDVLLGFSCPVKLLTKRPSLVCNGGFFVPESVSFFDSSEIINLYILLLYKVKICTAPQLHFGHFSISDPPYWQSGFAGFKESSTGNITISLTSCWTFW